MCRNFSSEREIRVFFPPAGLEALSREVPFAEMSGDVSAIDALVELKLAASKSAARRLIEQGGVAVNGNRVSSATDSMGDALAGGYFLIKKGARDFGLVRLAPR